MAENDITDETIEVSRSQHAPIENVDVLSEFIHYLEEINQNYAASKRRATDGYVKQIIRRFLVLFPTWGLRRLIRQAKRLQVRSQRHESFDKLIEEAFQERRVLRSDLTPHPRFPKLALTATKLGQQLCREGLSRESRTTGTIMQIFGGGPAGFQEAFEKYANTSNLDEKHFRILGIEALRARDLLKVASERAFEPRKGLVAYMAAMSMPYSMNGYSSRTEGVALGYMENGLDVEVITKAGFPLNILGSGADAYEINTSDNINGVNYHRTIEPLVDNRNYTEYARKAADALENKLRELRPEYVIAASNYENSVPALIAARRLGLPFYYEVRGMWELTRASENPGYEQTRRFAVMQQLEFFVCSNADKIWTLTQGMKDNLVERGIDADKIALMPNGVSPDMLITIERDDALATEIGISKSSIVVGYAGAIKEYEGLQDLAAAVAQLAVKGLDVVLLILGAEKPDLLGNTPITSEVKETFESIGVSKNLFMLGRVPFENIKSYYSIMDICPITRRGYTVSELVSPIKPVEVLAQSKAAVLSDVEALKFFSQNETTALLYQKGNVDHLASQLERLIKDEVLRQNLGIRGRQFVEDNLQWSNICSRAASHFEPI